jgi:ribosomal protein S27AE
VFQFDQKENTMTQKKDPKQIMQEFKTHQNRQFIAIAAALFFVLLCAVVYKRPDLFGAYSKGTLFGAQAVIIASYIGFTSQNWRCPACGKRLGTDINRQICKKCGARLR